MRKQHVHRGATAALHFNCANKKASSGRTKTVGKTNKKKSLRVKAVLAPSAMEAHSVRNVLVTHSTTQQTRLLTLSDDVLIRVASYLPIKEHVPIRVTCRRLRRVCDSDMLWGSLCASGSIAPAAPLTWRGLGLRLSCHKWCYASMEAEARRDDENSRAREDLLNSDDETPNDEGRDLGAELLESAASPTTTSRSPASSPAPATVLAPQGRWLNVVESGLRYKSFPDAVLPLVDLIASSRPLSHIKGNNTASIGLIPIDLCGPPDSVRQSELLSKAEDREKADGEHPNIRTSHDESSHPEECQRGKNKAEEDPAVALHQKLFSAMGVEFTGDWGKLCDVMRPIKKMPGGSQPSARSALENATSSTASNAATAGASALLHDPTCPSLHVFDTMPHNGQRRVMAMCLSPGDAEEHPNATAKFVEVLLTTCSTVIFAARSAESLSSWLAMVSPHMTLVASPSPFSTADNTPNIVFMTEAPIPSLRDVFFPSAPSPSDAKGIAGMRAPKEAFSWVLNRSSCVGEVVFADTSCPISLKTFYAPSWVAPECSLPVPAPSIARMILAAGAADGSAATTDGLWTKDVVQSVCQGHARQCVAFYEDAMRTEISEANRPAISFTNLPVPMEPVEIVSIQDHFFYAALRSYAMAVRHACGSNTAQGMALLEEFKKDISTSFRRLWAANITTSRAYCTQLFENVFFAVHEKYNGESGGNGFQDKRALHQWFSAVTDKISEYVIKAKGQRKMDVLAERIVTRTIGGLKNFCLLHPEHPYVRIEDVTVAGAEISEYCAGQLALYHKEQDEVLSVKQRNSAMYTACLGTMWACESVEEAIKHLTMQGPEYDTWAELLQLKREGFGLAPSALMSLAVTAPSSNSPRQHLHPHVGHVNLSRATPSGEADSNTENDGSALTGEDVASETNSVSASHASSSGFRASSHATRSRASSGVTTNTRVLNVESPNSAASPIIGAAASSSGGVIGFFTNIWTSFGNNQSISAASSASPYQNHPQQLSSSSGHHASPQREEREGGRTDQGGSGGLRRLSLIRLRSRKNSPSRSERKRRKELETAVKKGECVLFTELEYERQALLKDLVRKLSEHKQRMESVGKQFSLRSDQTSDFNVIQRQFSSGFKDYRTARKTDDAADEIASKLRAMRERVRNSFASTRE